MVAVSAQYFVIASCIGSVSIVQILHVVSCVHPVRVLNSA